MKRTGQNYKCDYFIKVFSTEEIWNTIRSKQEKERKNKKERKKTMSDEAREIEKTKRKDKLEKLKINDSTENAKKQWYLPFYLQHRHIKKTNISAFIVWENAESLMINHKLV